jgi:rhodanese-related sulfurtransferase
MRHTLLSFIILFAITFAKAQYKYDNVKFSTVYLEDLCKTLQNNADFIILDVRSKGEHDDTSSALNLNIGHLKNAINIDVRELPTRLNELNAYHDKPVFVYCSHSQRSRRASKMLSDSGFAKVFNINGGLTNLHLLENNLSSCSEVIMETNVPYKLISPQQLSYNIRHKKSYFIIDVRRDSVFNSTTLLEREKAQGQFETAHSIPLDKFASSISGVPKNKPLLIVDEFGNESPKAAKLLIEKGYKDVSVLFNGMEAWVQFQSDYPEQPLKWRSQIMYQPITAEGFDKLMRSNKEVFIADIRTKDEFNNQFKDTWRNIGHLKNAFNIPFTDLQNVLSSITVPKTTPIVIYSFSGNNDIYQAARLFYDAGYKNVNVLLGGIFNLRWKAANLKGKSQLKEWAVNIPEENL